MSKSYDDLVRELRARQQQIIERLAPLAERQDSRPAPDHWSFRYIAAHLATVERVCVLERVQRIAEGTHPYFDYYLDTESDFSRIDLTDALQTWQSLREEAIRFVGELPREKWHLTGTHASFGTIDVLQVLEIILDHDREHLEEIEWLLAQMDDGARG